MCRELAELGMEMARDAAQAARHEWATAEPAASAAQPQPIPKPTSTTQPPQTHTRTPHTYRETASPSLAFARITRAIKQIIQLEITIAAQHQAELEKQQSRAHTQVYFKAQSPCRTPTTTTPGPAPTQPTRQPDRQASNQEIPSLLANLSREMGMDLTNPAVAARLPSFLLPDTARPP